MSVESKLFEIVVETNPAVSLNGASDLDLSFSELGLDSLEAMSVMLGAQEYYELQIDDSEFDNVQSLADLKSLIEAALAKSVSNDSSCND